jgi:uncharacterized phage protein (TIGR01671 family)
MRQIKFRVWNKTYEEMFYPGSPTLNGDYVEKFYLQLNGVLRGDFKRTGDVDCTEDYVIQQFTGLLDAEGREIYEGDVIRGLFYDTEYHIEEEITSTVTWVERNAGFNIGSKNWHKPSLVVQGHIFEKESKEV